MVSGFVGPYMSKKTGSQDRFSCSVKLQINSTLKHRSFFVMALGGPKFDAESEHVVFSEVGWFLASLALTCPRKLARKIGFLAMFNCKLTRLWSVVASL